ncbi:MAG TPA: hypothetical protein VHB54_17940 [Mucilaginibacter sp.]|nr:hypothetical protein [Mucilaginibacter sp.]
MKRAYYYLFYKFYRFGELSPSNLPSDFTATFAIAVLEVLFFTALNFYYIDFVDPAYVFGFSAKTIIPLVLILLINYFAFIRTDKWKVYVKEFDATSENEKNRGTLIVWGIVIFIIALFAYSVHMMSVETGIK